VRGHKKINSGGITLKTAVYQKMFPYDNNNNIFLGSSKFEDEILIQIWSSEYRPRTLQFKRR
jgi:hypothetical protein